MAVKGQQIVEKELSGYKKFVGFSVLKLNGFNPATVEEKKALGGYVKDGDTSLDYVADKDGTAYAIFDFYLQDTNSEFKYPKRLFLRNEFRKGKDESKFNAEGMPRTQYINAIGQTSWVYEEKELSEKFKAYSYHKARSGEEEIITFLKALFNLEFKAELTYDWKKVFNGNFKEIAADCAEYARTIILPLEVELRPSDDGGVKEIQTNYNCFIPGTEAKFLMNKKFYSKKDIEAIAEKEAYNKQLWSDKKEGNRVSEKNKWITDLEKAVLEMSRKSQNCSYLGVAKEFKKEDYEQAGSSTHLSADDEFDTVPAVAGVDELDY